MSRHGLERIRSRDGHTSDPETIIRALPIWNGRIDIEPLLGGITNKNYLVTDAERRAVVRFGGDIPVHGVMRFNELAATRAAGEAGISPKVLYTGPSSSCSTISPDTATAPTTRAPIATVASPWSSASIARSPGICAVRRSPSTSSTSSAITRIRSSRTKAAWRARLPRFLAAAEALERAVGPIDLVFAHNDLLAANFIDDGQRLWLVDWDYAGWNTPLFDLGGLASNNGFDAGDNDAMLSAYFEAPVTDALRRKFHAMLCASLLREAMWSMVSERRSTIDFDYVAYTDENLRRFDAAWTAFQQMEQA